MFKPQNAMPVPSHLRSAFSSLAQKRHGKYESKVAMALRKADALDSCENEEFLNKSNISEPVHEQTHSEPSLNNGGIELVANCQHQA